LQTNGGNNNLCGVQVGKVERGRGLWRVTVIETMRGKTRVIKTIKSGSDKLKQRQQLPQCPAARTTTKCSVKF